MTTVWLAVLVLTIFGIVLGLILAIFSKVFHVEIDTRIEDVHDFLPNMNCGGCGFPGCMGFADGIVNGQVEKLTLCKPASKDNLTKIIEYLEANPNADGSKVKIKM